MDGSEQRSQGRGFVVMPFGRKTNAKGEEIDFEIKALTGRAPIVIDPATL